MRYATDEDFYLDKTKKQLITCATLAITHRCNLKCIHCFNLRDPRKKELSLKEVFSVIEQLADAGVISLTLSGGEPFAHKNFFEIASYARKLGFGLSIVTNATLITEENADKIAALFPYAIKVTIYGPNENIYGKTTGKPDMFHKVVQGIRALSVRKLPVRVTTPFFNFLSIEDMKETKKIIEDFGLELSPQVSFFPKSNTNGHEPLRYDLTDESKYEACFRIFPNLYRKARISSPKPNREVCSHDGTASSVYIDSYGYVGICYLVQSKYSIRGKPLLHIWRNDPVLKGIRKLRWKNMTRCLKCEYRPWCQPCPAYNYCYTKSLNKPAAFLCRHARIKKRVYEKLN